MNRIRLLLRWLRLEDEQGQLSLTTIAFTLGVIALVRNPLSLVSLIAFGLALAAYVHKRHRQHCVTELAMDGAQTAALDRQSHEHELRKLGHAEDVVALDKKVEDLVDKVLMVTSPERLQGLKEAWRKKA